MTYIEVKFGNKAHLKWYIIIGQVVYNIETQENYECMINSPTCN